MKEYIKLSVDVTAYHSGSTYYEEVFLPKDVWEEIADTIQMHTYIYGLDGKHSEVRAEIEAEEFNENYLVNYERPSEDGENLFYHVYEHLDEEKYDNHYLLTVQEEVALLCQAESMTIKFNKKDKDKILELLNGYQI